MVRTGFLTSCFILSIFLFGCEDKIKPTVLKTINSQDLPQQESWNSVITVSDSGRVNAIIHAGYIRIYEETQQTEMSKGVFVRFFNPQGVQTSYLTSDEGTADENSNNLEARHNVVVVSNDSSRLRTERLFWDNHRQLIYTPEFVDITTAKEHLQGHGFESDQSLKNYRIYRVTGQAKTN